MQGCSDCPDPRLRGTHTLEILIVTNENKPRDTALNSVSAQAGAAINDYGLNHGSDPSFYPHKSLSLKFSSATQSCPTLCNPMNRSTPGLPVHHQLPKSTKTHVHRVGDAIQPSHPLSSPSPPAPNPSQYQGSFPMSQLFASGGQSIGVSASASVLPMNAQD